MSALKIASVTLGELPRVAVAVRDNADLSEIAAAMANGASFVEARIDEFASQEPGYVRDQLERLAPHPIIATIRHHGEGGAWHGPEADRLALYESILPLVHAVDAEIYSREVFAPLAKMVRAARKTVIGSYHDFEGMPSTRKMNALATYGHQRGAHIIKIAAMCRRKDDLAALARFTLVRGEATPLIVIGMGPRGMASRIFFPALGSLLTYTFLGAGTAPGQLTCDDTLKYLSTFFPGFR